MSEAYASFVAALSEMRNPTKDREVKVPGKYNFQYAELNGILDSVRETLGRHGLGVVQPFSIVDGGLCLETKIIHKSGEIVLLSSSVVPAPSQPQQLGSLVTYLRRYSLCSAVGIASVDDDDGAAAADMSRPVEKKQRPEKAPVEVVAAVEVSPEIRAELSERLAIMGVDVEKLNAWLKGSKRPDIFHADEETRTKILEFLSTEAGRKKAGV